jgi:Ca-activated chloride channel family protein
MFDYLQTLQFANPWLLTLLVLPLLFGLWQWWQYRRLYPTLTLPILQGVKGHNRPLRGFIKKYLFVWRALAVALLVIALARPQRRFSEENVNTEGIDIVLVMDISQSMEAMDFRPNRLEAAKEKAAAFVSERPNDRVGLVIFSGQSFTQSPLTTDHGVILSLIKAVNFEMLKEPGTAIGMGLATAVIRLKESQARSKVVVLLTDGDNNSGFIDPITAADAAKQNDIRVYTIGVGKNGDAPYRMATPFGGYRTVMQPVRLDEALLKDIATTTGGKYFNVRSNQGLEEVYDEIDRLEKTRIEVTQITRRTEEFHWFLIMAGILLMIEWILRYAVVRSIP